MTTQKTTAARKKNPASTALAAAPDALLSELIFHALSGKLTADFGRGLNVERAEYGKEILSTVSKELMAEFGRGFTKANFFNRVRCAEVFPDEKIVSALRTQLGWTHFKAIIPLDDPLKRHFISCEPQG